MKEFKHTYPIIGNKWLGWKVEAIIFGSCLVVALVSGLTIYIIRGY